MKENICYIVADWGGSFLRLWGLDAAYNTAAAGEYDCGAATLRAPEFEPVLLQAIEKLAPRRLKRAEQTARTEDAPLPLLLCGMVGAHDGWRQAPYRVAPCAPLPPPNAAIPAPSKTAAIRAALLPGVSQARPPDVMRGEETQLAGLLSRCPTFEGSVCLPGTHSKWVQIQQGKILRFTTAMSGELYGLLRRHSALRRAVSVNIEDGDEGSGGRAGRKKWDSAAFQTALRDTAANPAAAAAKLFQIRADRLLNARPVAAGSARLSGILLGLEFAAAREYWQSQPVALIAAEALGDIYETAMHALGIKAARYNGREMSLAGLTQYLKQ